MDVKGSGEHGARTSRSCAGQNGLVARTDVQLMYICGDEGQHGCRCSLACSVFGSVTEVIIMLSYESTSLLLTLLWLINAAGYKKQLGSKMDGWYAEPRLGAPSPSHGASSPFAVKLRERGVWFKMI